MDDQTKLRRSTRLAEFTKSESKRTYKSDVSSVFGTQLIGFQDYIEGNKPEWAYSDEEPNRKRVRKTTVRSWVNIKYCLDFQTASKKEADNKKQTRPSKAML